MDKNIQELHKVIIDAGRSSDTAKLNVEENSEYHIREKGSGTFFEEYYLIGLNYMELVKT